MLITFAAKNVSKNVNLILLSPLVHNIHSFPRITHIYDCGYDYTFLWRIILFQQSITLSNHGIFAIRRLSYPLYPHYPQIHSIAVQKTAFANLTISFSVLLCYTLSCFEEA